MARHKYEFRPDKTGSGLLSKLYLTQKQRLSLLKWGLYGLTLLVLSVLQDVILCRVSIFGATTDLLPCVIFLICIYQGAENGGVFAVVASALYQFSGTAPGYYIIAVITLLGVFAAIFRQGYLRKSMGADLLCAGIIFALYELIVFFVAVAAGNSSVSRIPTVAITFGLTTVVTPALYALIATIDKIGGNSWKE